MRALTLILCLASLPALAADDDPRTVDWSLQGSVQFTPQSGAFWGLTERFPPPVRYDTSPVWGEYFFKPRVAVEWPFANGVTAYGAVSGLASGTVGTDPFDQGTVGRLWFEEYYAGLRVKTDIGDWDASVGARDYRMGQGMLVSLGGGNGFERGAMALAPHRAWEETAIVSWRRGAWLVEGFALDPDELSSGDTRTRLHGARAAWSPSADAELGLAWIGVDDSQAPYPQAPLTLIPSGREGLRTWDVHGRWSQAPGGSRGFSISGEIAWQRNDRINMRAWGAVADVGYRFATTKFTPRLSYSPRYFSGDDPGTPDRLERFDPLFYDGAPATWSSGANGSFAFYNANLWVQRLKLEAVFGPRDFASLSYYDVRAAEINSPLQYGQAARLLVVDGRPQVVSGVPHRPLTREWYFEHTHVFNAHWYLTWGLAAASPQRGLRALVGENATTWYGGLVNVTFQY